jgi:tRNA threonylcarbamoyladenosine biosynthesis protein TsaB
MQVVKPQCAVDISEIIRELNELSGEVIFLGDGVPVFKDRIANEMQIPYGFAPAHQNRQRASAVAALAEIYYKEGKMVSAKDHGPDYLRLSQAERERMEQDGVNGK